MGTRQKKMEEDKTERVISEEEGTRESRTDGGMRRTRRQSRGGNRKDKDKDTQENRTGEDKRTGNQSEEGRIEQDKRQVLEDVREQKTMGHNPSKETEQEKRRSAA